MAGPRVLIEKQETVSYTRMYMVCVTEHVWKDIYKYGRNQNIVGRNRYVHTKICPVSYFHMFRLEIK
jgi:hypothetical protein